METRSLATKKKRLRSKTLDDRPKDEQKDEQYEVRWSDELFLPMRKERGGSKPWEAGCPIDLGDRANNLDQMWAKATWPDGFQATLFKTYGEMRSQMLPNHRSNDALGSKIALEGIHKTTKNTVKLDQRVDRKLLIAI